MEQLERLAVFFGGGPQAAIAALMAVAVAVLFTLLMRAKRDHLQTALMLGPIAQKMELALQGFHHRLSTNTEQAKAMADELQELKDQVTRMVVVFDALQERAAGRGRGGPNKPPSSRG